MYSIWLCLNIFFSVSYNPRWDGPRVARHVKNIIHSFICNFYFCWFEISGTHLNFLLEPLYPSLNSWKCPRYTVYKAKVKTLECFCLFKYTFALRYSKDFIIHPENILTPRLTSQVAWKPRCCQNIDSTWRLSWIPRWLLNWWNCN